MRRNISSRITQERSICLEIAFSPVPEEARGSTEPLLELNSHTRGDRGSVLRQRAIRASSMPLYIWHRSCRVLASAIVLCNRPLKVLTALY